MHQNHQNFNSVIFLKSPYLDKGFYRFDKTWLLFYHIDIEKAFKTSETALNYINHKRTNLLRLFITQWQTRRDSNSEQREHIDLSIIVSGNKD
jgi:hypothetical protein